MKNKISSGKSLPFYIKPKKLKYYPVLDKYAQKG